MSNRLFARALLGLFAGVLAASAQKVEDLEKRITEFDLPNGLHFIVLERHTAPVFAGLSYVNAGAANDPAGKAGIAHMFEHMAFKGTPSIGSKNYAAEKAALDALEKTYDALEEERRKGPRADKTKITKLEADVKAGIDKTFAQVDQDAFTRMVEENGAVGLNAGTSMDATTYFMSLPANRLEMWFMLESDRFISPVFREFYKERGVVRNEYAMRIESDPQGQLITALMNTAFADSPYHVGYAGIPSDIDNLRVADALAFRKTYYVPSNITIVVAGDVTPTEVKALATKYFGPMPAGPLPPPVITKEQEQRGEKRVAIETDSQPMLAIGYKRPDALQADDPVFDVISGILSQGRTGRLYKDLVEEKKLALGSAAYATFPGGKQDNLYIIFSVPNSGKTIEELEKATYDIIEKLKNEPVDDATLKRVKINVRAGLIRSLNSNIGMANALAAAHVGYGNWKKLYSQLDDLDKITAADVQRVVKTYFISKGRTVAYMSKATPAAKETK